MKKIVNSVSKRNKNRGKQVERKVAKLLGGKRIGTMGGEDIAMDKYSVEVKSRKKISVVDRFEKMVKNKEKIQEIEVKRSVLDRWWEQAMKHAESKEPVLVCHVMNSKRYYAVVSLELFKKLAGIEDE